MCGRYGFVPISSEKLKTRFNLATISLTLKPRYNVTPGQLMPVILRKSPNQIKEMRWGLVPFWAKDIDIGYRMINARAETIAVKPSFRKSLVSKRCIIPATHFYEWQRNTAGKQPFYIHLKNGAIFAFAGLYDIWHDAENHQLWTFTIITTDPNSLIATIHDRMPVILNESDEDLWLNSDIQDIQRLLSLLKPYSENLMQIYPITKAVNNPENDSIKLTKPLS